MSLMLSETHKYVKTYQVVYFKCIKLIFYQLNLNEDVKNIIFIFYYMGIWIFQKPYCEIKLWLETFSNHRLEVRRLE